MPQTAAPDQIKHEAITGEAGEDRKPWGSASKLTELLGLIEDRDKKRAATHYPAPRFIRTGTSAVYLAKDADEEGKNTPDQDGHQRREDRPKPRLDL